MVCFLDVNGYLTFRATGQKVFEWSCASAVAFDIKKKDWMRMILSYIGLDPNSSTLHITTASEDRGARY
jgi:sugar (pentulose or hexulose) kinase